ncbi:MAG: hypothetical protein WC378_09540 [Opitutaceae bacterium]|jgi:hypothetical protein
MKSLFPILAFAFVLSGCYVRFVEGADSPLAQYVGRHAEVRKKVIVYERGVFFGRFGVPAGEWPVSKKEEVKATLEPGLSFEVVAVSSRRTESGKHYYLVCRYHTAGEEVTFDYPADGKFIGYDYILWL